MKFKLKTVNLKSLGELLNSDDEYDPKMIQMILNLKRGLTLKVNHSWLKKKDLNVPSVTQPSDGGVDLRAIPSHNIQDSSNFLSVGGASNPKESLKSTLNTCTVSMMKQQQYRLIVTQNLTMKKTRVTQKITTRRWKKMFPTVTPKTCLKKIHFARLAIKNCAQNR